MVNHIGDLLTQRAADGFVGREAELAHLTRMLDDDAEPVWFVHGIGGIGKSRLLAAFAAEAGRRRAEIVWLDCRAIEPTVAAFLRAIAPDNLGLDHEVVADRLGAGGERVLLVLDGFDSFRLLETWLRQRFIPALPANVRVVIAGQSAPGAAWLTAPGWAGLLRSVAIGPLRDADAAALLAPAGIGRNAAAALNRAVRGHPLALQLVAATSQRQPAALAPAGALASAVAELAGLFLNHAEDPTTRRTVEAASVVRRVTRPLLGAMLPGDDADGAWRRLARLPFVEHAADGLVLHETVQAAIAANLRAADPEAYRDLRRAAWRRLHQAAITGGEADAWRRTADLLFLVENPTIREGFFPGGAPPYPVEPAIAEDEPAIAAITRRDEGPEAARALLAWWERAPQTFWVVRGPSRAVLGFTVLLSHDEVAPELMSTDPILRVWGHHLRREPLPGGQRALFNPRSFPGGGDLAEGVRAAFWIHAKRWYMEMRPRLRRTYVAEPDPITAEPALLQLGFRRLPGADVTMDGRVYRTLVLDFGAGSVDGWLTRLIAAELGLAEVDGILDIGARELVIDGKRTSLTRLEFEVAHYLQQREGRAVSRADLLADVWGVAYDGGSNVVDAVVRGLRRKLGPRADVVEAVRGTGYRWRER